MSTTFDRGSTTSRGDGIKRYSLTRHISSDQAQFIRITTQDLVSGVVSTLIRDMERKHDRYVHPSRISWCAWSDIRSRDLMIRVWIDLQGMTVEERDIASRIWHAGRKAGARSYTEPPYSQPFYLSPWE